MDTKLWNRLFPFFIKVNPQTQIIEAGESIQKLLPTLVGKPLHEVLKVVRPKLSTLSFVEMRRFEAQVFIFKTRTGGLTFKGQVIPDTPDTLILGISLWLTDIEQMTQLGLRIQDFALHDPILDFLQLLNITQLTNQDLLKQTEALRKAKKRADSALAAKTEFLSVMTHEIRTPLNAIIGMSNILLEEEPQPFQLDYLETLQFSAQNLLSLVNDILDFSKLEAGKVPLERECVRLPKLIRELANTLTPTALEKGLSLDTHMGEGIPRYTWTDPWRLCQILTNLIGNAIKFTSTGGVSISMHTQPCEKAGWAKVRFEVKDTGIGIPEERIRNIFEPFTQAEGSTSRRFGGTGLGLSITAKLLEVMGSRIEVDSVLDEGSTFGFTLNLEVAPAPATTRTTPKSHTISAEGHILVVEDNKINAKILCRYLKKWGLSYDVAYDGEEAIQKFQESRYDLVLMDILMPRVDGYRATEAIRSLATHHSSEVPIVALSASLFEEVIEKVKQVGMNDFLNKPFKTEALKNMLQKYLSPELDDPAI